MAKKKGGRSNFKGHYSYSPHAREDLKSLRALGVTQNEIVQFRREAKKYLDLQEQMVRYNTAMGVRVHTTVPSYESIIEAYKHGDVNIKDITIGLRSARKQFERYGTTIDYISAVSEESDFVNDEFGFEVMTPERLSGLDETMLSLLQTTINELHRYIDMQSELSPNANSSRRMQVQDKIDKIKNDILNILQ